MKINYKKCLYYGICLGFAIIGAISMENNLSSWRKGHSQVITYLFKRIILCPPKT